jgi:hypothetical protein
MMQIDWGKRASGDVRSWHETYIDPVMVDVRHRG